jgi:hypothetical protein
MGSLANHVKRIRAAVEAYRARVPQHDEHLYTWRAWMFDQEFRVANRGWYAGNWRGSNAEFL